MAEQAMPGSFLALLAEADREALLRLGGLRRFNKGEHLMHQGEPGDRVLLLLSGRVKATFLEPNGQEVVLNFRGPGDVLGELSFVDVEPRSSNVLAMEFVEARALPATAFRSFLEQVPNAALMLIDVIGRRFRDASRAQVEFAALDTVGRVAARLIELCERYGQKTETGIEIRLPLTQSDLGGWAASSRAAVGETLQTMRRLGWIKTQRRRITVIDQEALSKRATQ